MAPEEILSSADTGRRDFLKKVLAGTTFAAPVIASFSMEGLSPEHASAAAAANQCSNQSLSECCQLALRLAIDIVLLEARVLQNALPIETAKRFIDKLDKAKAAMIEGIAKGKGECVSGPSLDQFKKAAKEMGKFEDLVAEFCGTSDRFLIPFADEIIDGITHLVEGECSEEPC